MRRIMYVLGALLWTTFQIDGVTLGSVRRVPSYVAFIMDCLARQIAQSPLHLCCDSELSDAGFSG